jgi:hypothetical protein
MNEYEQRDEKGHVAESLWKYLLITELALAVEESLGTRPAGAMPDSAEWELLTFIAENADWIKADFGSRLERAVDRLIQSHRPGKLADQRKRVAEALHAGPIRELRSHLAPALAVRERIFIIVDNLDKAWDKEADIRELSRLILGLLACMDSLRHDLERDGSGVPVGLSLFIRNDIFSTVSALAREPDKLPVRRISWRDETSLIEIVDQRYAASRERQTGPDELWERYFCETMVGLPTKEWVVRTCLPRPRDVLYLCRAAIDQALGRRHGRVESEDLGAAERQYSLFAFEAVVVEAQQRVPRIEDVLLEFAGVMTDLTADQLTDLLKAAQIDPADHSDVIDVLTDAAFLGRLTSEGAIYPDSPREKQRADVLARRYARETQTPIKYTVHPAFWGYLEMRRGDLNLSLGL